nr:response regulator [Enterovibrio nigricans]
MSVSQKKSRAKKRTTLIFKVCDTGIGMTDAQLNRLFSQYHQADPSTSRRFGGTGLGLTISQKLVNLMKGEIHIQSAYGLGTECEFSARFERLQEAMQANLLISDTSDDLSSLNVTELKNGHVLVVDDNTINREMIRELLSSLGMIVSQVGSGEEALDAIKQQCFSLILMDLRMTGMDGIEATRALRKLPNGNTVPVIALSANTTASMAETCIRAGMNDYVPKPVDFRRLIQVIANHLVNRDSINECAKFTTFNPTAALLRLGSNKAVYIKMLGKFLSQRESRLGDLKRIASAADRDAQKHAFHELKGIAATLGADRLSRISGTLEAQCDSRSIVDKDLTQIVGEFERLTAVVQAYLDANVSK